jgi:ribosome maturation factor RimP
LSPQIARRGFRDQPASLLPHSSEGLVISQNTAMYKDIPDEFRRVVEPVVQAHGLELVDAGIGRGPTRSLVRVVVDTPVGDGRVLLDECAAISREVGHGLDVSDLLPGAYTLEVCSPGVDRTLGREVDFTRVVGRRVAIETRTAIEGRRRFRGLLVAFADGVATVQSEGRELAIPFAAIDRAQDFFPFESPQKPKR